jgi:hypothetical protein
VHKALFRAVAAEHMKTEEGFMVRDIAIAVIGITLVNL